MGKGKSIDTCCGTGMSLSEKNFTSPLKGGGIFTYEETSPERLSNFPMATQLG